MAAGYGPPLLWEEDEVGGKQAAVDAYDPGIAGLSRRPAEAFMAYNCSNRSNIVESYWLLEPDDCAFSDGNGEMETVVYREIQCLPKGLAGRPQI